MALPLRQPSKAQSLCCSVEAKRVSCDTATKGTRSNGVGGHTTQSDLGLKRAVRQLGRMSSGAARLLIALFNSLSSRRGVFSPEDVATALYKGILDREPDVRGFADKVTRLRSGQELQRVI